MTRFEVGEIVGRLCRWQIANLKPGQYTVRVSLDGFEPTAFPVEIKPGQGLDLGVIKLAASTGKLYLSSKPVGVRFRVSSTDNPSLTLSGTTPRTLPDLPVGAYTVVFQQPGWDDHMAQVRVTRGSPANVEWEFPQGKLVVSSSPRSASITVDGVPQGQAGNGNSALPIDLPMGEHKVIATYETGDLAPQTREVRVEKGRATNLEFAFAEAPAPAPEPTPKRREETPQPRVVAKERERDNSDENDDKPTARKPARVVAVRERESRPAPEPTPRPKPAPPPKPAVVKQPPSKKPANSPNSAPPSNTFQGTAPGG